MIVSRAVRQGRDAIAHSAWAGAFRALAKADRQHPLGPARPGASCPRRLHARSFRRSPRVLEASASRLPGRPRSAARSALCVLGRDQFCDARTGQPRGRLVRTRTAFRRPRTARQRGARLLAGPRAAGVRGGAQLEGRGCSCKEGGANCGASRRCGSFRPRRARARTRPGASSAASRKACAYGMKSWCRSRRANCLRS